MATDRVRIVDPIQEATQAKALDKENAKKASEAKRAAEAKREADEIETELRAS